jgi:hypothetical protein
VTFRHAAETVRRPDNAADGRFSTACTVLLSYYGPSKPSCYDSSYLLRKEQKSNIKIGLTLPFNLKTTLENNRNQMFQITTQFYILIQLHVSH